MVLYTRTSAAPSGLCMRSADRAWEDVYGFDEEVVFLFVKNDDSVTPCFLELGQCCDVWRRSDDLINLLPYVAT